MYVRQYIVAGVCVIVVVLCVVLAWRGCGRVCSFSCVWSRSHAEETRQFSRVTQALRAVERYRKTHRSFPASLQELVDAGMLSMEVAEHVRYSASGWQSLGDPKLVVAAESRIHDDRVVGGSVSAGARYVEIGRRNVAAFGF